MNWTSSVNGEPGIFTEVMEALKTLKAEDKHCNLCMDAMALRKQILWSDKFNKFVGYCDFGGVTIRRVGRSCYRSISFHVSKPKWEMEITDCLRITK